MEPFNIKWLKKEQPSIKSLEEVKKEDVIEYLQRRQSGGKSAYTISKDMSALNKIFNTNVSKNDAGLIERSYKDVTRSRVERQNDKKYNPQNYINQITFAKACGCRRESILGGQYQVKPCSVWKDTEGNIYVSLIEKGGRFRNAPVLQEYRKSIEMIVPNLVERSQNKDLKVEESRFKELYKNSQEDVLFSKYTKKIDNHAFRAEYARNRYEELLEEKRDLGCEILCNYRGYARDCIEQVSKDLGHNRPSVVVEHYLR